MIKLTKRFQYAVLIGAVVMLTKGYTPETVEYWLVTSSVAVGLVI